ncbi:hypothetical protein KY285_000384 [Solanum tuberosum]|nr:hypothetical protein KY285_000384 [Solanum tuberosum]
MACNTIQRQRSSWSWPPKTRQDVFGWKTISYSLLVRGSMCPSLGLLGRRQIIKESHDALWLGIQGSNERGRVSAGQGGAEATERDT